MNTLFNSLPVETQAKVKSALSAYNSCTVEKNDQGVYKVLTCTVIHNGNYSEIVGEFTKDQIFTHEEQIVNYVNTFREFPYPSYKGAKDWKALSSDWKNATLENGEIKFHF